jgi:hypothetical protein
MTLTLYGVANVSGSDLAWRDGDLVAGPFFKLGDAIEAWKRAIEQPRRFEIVELRGEFEPRRIVEPVT